MQDRVRRSCISETQANAFSGSQRLDLNRNAIAVGPTTENQKIGECSGCANAASVVKRFNEDPCKIDRRRFRGQVGVGGLLKPTHNPASGNAGLRLFKRYETADLFTLLHATRIVGSSQTE